MRRMISEKIVPIVLVTLVLNISYVMNVYAVPQVYVNSYAWGSDLITVFIRLRPDLTGWKDSYVQDVRDAVSNWETSITPFTSQYGYTYLNQFTFPILVVDTFPFEKEIRIDFVWNDPTRSGWTDPYTFPGNRMSRADIFLDLEDAGRIGMTRIACHEFGHGLQLGHSNYVGDLMYSSNDPAQWGSIPSTLDIYGLAVAYEWLKTGTFAAPTAGWYSLPPAIPYKTLFGGVGGIAVSVDKLSLLAPYIGLTSMIVVATAATAIYIKRIKHRKENESQGKKTLERKEVKISWKHALCKGHYHLLP